MERCANKKRARARIKTSSTAAEPTEFRTDDDEMR